MGNTADMEYRLPFSMMLNSMWKGKDKSNMFTNSATFFTFKHFKGLHTIRGRFTLKDGVVNERIIFRNRSLCEVKKANEWNDLVKVLLEPNQKSKLMSC